MTPLRQAMIDAMHMRRFSPRTQESYLSAVGGLARYTRRSPDTLTPAEVEDFFQHLVLKRHLAPSTCRLFFHGIRFLYLQVLGWPPDSLSITLPKRPQRIPQLLTQEWSDKQQAQVLPVTYHHLIFTLPHLLNPWVALHEREIYALLFASVWATLSAFASDPRRLGGRLGMTAVLHTWGQVLTRHVHLHCLVPGGALSRKGEWHSAKGEYLFPVRALSRHLRGGFVSRLRQAWKEGKLSRIQDPAEVDRMLDALMARDWVVYSKPSLQHTDTVVRYLARYSHRIALSNQRLLSFDGERVELAYKDYRDGRNKVMTLDADELLRRFLLHVLPKGFMRIRHFGFLANRCRKQRLPQIREAIADQAARQAERQALAAERAAQRDERDLAGYPCPKCKRGRLQVIGTLDPRPSPYTRPQQGPPGGGH